MFWHSPGNSCCACPFRKYCCTEYTLKRLDETTILRDALLHSKSVQHLVGAIERDLGRFLPDSHRRQENWDKPILSPWQPVAWMSGYLQNEMSVPAFVEQAARRWPPYGKSTKDERPR
jgi:hypothetical protein